MCVPVNKTGLASLLAPIRSLKCGQRTALEHTSADFLLQRVQGPGASRELAEFTALEFLGPNKLRRQCPARGTEAGSFGPGRERVDAGSGMGVRWPRQGAAGARRGAWPPGAGGRLSEGLAAVSRDMLRREPGRFRHSALIAPSCAPAPAPRGCASSSPGPIAPTYRASLARWGVCGSAGHRSDAGIEETAEAPAPWDAVDASPGSGCWGHLSLKSPHLRGLW